MRKYYIFFLGLIISSLSLVSFEDPRDDEKERMLLGVLEYILENGHYDPISINDSFSEDVFDKFINTLDPSKRYFLQSDIDRLSIHRDLIDDQFKNQDLSFFNAVYSVFEMRKNATAEIYTDILSQPFNYEKQEVLDTDYDHSTWASNQNQLIDTWRKQLKLTTVSRIYDKMEVEKDKSKNDANYTVKSFDEIEVLSRNIGLENMDKLYDRMNEMRRIDWLGIYVNLLVEEFDPHSAYFDPEIKKRFDISMSGSLEGIGARLSKEKEYTKVVEIISGGPAWKKGELEVGDLILSVAQEGEEPVDIVGMHLDDAINFIKGKKGTIVSLTIRKVDGTTEVIQITRDVVNIEETFLKMSMVDMNDKKLGVINLPKFYIDFQDKSRPDSGSDMEKALKELNESDVDGVLIDLRNNGGGSLKTAIEIAGMFITKGPVVQTKYRGNEPQVLRDRDPKVQWDKPVVILVNELSASASEIFAAAMQDYDRAIIMGSKQSFGKGTVQNVIPLNEFTKDYDKDLGALKLTIQKFYRINGASTQLEGVHSDIALPNRLSYMDVGERDYSNPLAYDEIAPANYTPIHSYSNKNEVINQSNQRIINDPKFQLMNDYAKWTQANSKDFVYPLSYDAFVADAIQHEKDAERFDTVYKFDSNLEFYSPQSELSALAKDSILAKKRENWHISLQEDMYISEALKVLSELKMANSSSSIGKN